MADDADRIVPSAEPPRKPWLDTDAPVFWMWGLGIFSVGAGGSDKVGVTLVTLTAGVVIAFALVPRPGWVRRVHALLFIVLTTMLVAVFLVGL